jgi:hypothetical protein
VVRDPDLLAALESDTDEWVGRTVTITATADGVNTAVAP